MHPATAIFPQLNATRMAVWLSVAPAVKLGRLAPRAYLVIAAPLLLINLTSCGSNPTIEG